MPIIRCGTFSWEVVTFSVFILTNVYTSYVDFDWLYNKQLIVRLCACMCVYVPVLMCFCSKQLSAKSLVIFPMVRSPTLRTLPLTTVWVLWQRTLVTINSSSWKEWGILWELVDHWHPKIARCQCLTLTEQNQDVYVSIKNQILNFICSLILHS